MTPVFYTLLRILARSSKPAGAALKPASVTASAGATFGCSHRGHAMTSKARGFFKGPLDGWRPLLAAVLSACALGPTTRRRNRAGGDFENTTGDQQEPQREFWRRSTIRS